MFQRFALEEFHHDKRLTGMFVDFVNGTNMRMVQGGGGARFAQESFNRLFVRRRVRRKKLQGDGPAEHGIVSAINHAHPTTTKFLKDAVVRDGLAD